MPETVTLKILYIEIQFTTGRKKRKTAAISSAPIEGREKGRKSLIINFLAIKMARF